MVVYKYVIIFDKVIYRILFLKEDFYLDWLLCFVLICFCYVE